MASHQRRIHQLQETLRDRNGLMLRQLSEFRTNLESYVSETNVLVSQCLDTAGQCPPDEERLQVVTKRVDKVAGIIAAFNSHLSDQMGTTSGLALNQPPSMNEQHDRPTAYQVSDSELTQADDHYQSVDVLKTSGHHTTMTLKKEKVSDSELSEADDHYQSVDVLKTSGHHTTMTMKKEKVFDSELSETSNTMDKRPFDTTRGTGIPVQVGVQQRGDNAGAAEEETWDVTVSFSPQPEMGLSAENKGRPVSSSTDRTPLHTSAITAGPLVMFQGCHVGQSGNGGSEMMSCGTQEQQIGNYDLPAFFASGMFDVGVFGNSDKKKESDGKTVKREKGKKKESDRKQYHYVCDVCDKTFNQAGNLKRHKRIHTGDKPFVCDVCSKAFADPGNFNKHKRVHTGHKPSVCDVCNKAFTDAANLKKHKLIHIGKQFLCDVCSKTFTQAGQLKEHKLVHADLKPFVCDVCKKAFARANYLKIHKLSHTDHKKFVCDVCNKAFNLAYSLKAHQLTHSGRKPLVCDVCNKAFLWAGSLKTHMLIHSGHKKFVCDVCGKAFARAGNLKEHKLTHSDQKPFVCDVCSKAFNQAALLKKHRFIHNSDRQFLCDVCSKTFTQRAGLRKHRMIHTRPSKFECDVCKNGFTNSKSLKKHKLNHAPCQESNGTDLSVTENAEWNSNSIAF